MFVSDIFTNPRFFWDTLYGFGMFVKKNIIAVTLWTQVLVKKISPIESDFVH